VVVVPVNKVDVTAAAFDAAVVQVGGHTHTGAVSRKVLNWPKG
jgi:hypothetical protein